MKAFISSLLLLSFSIVGVAQQPPAATSARTTALCSSAWFTAERKEFSSKQRSFQLIEGGLFSQSGSFYAVAISHDAGTENDLELMIFAAPAQSADFRLVFTEKIEIPDTGMLSAHESQCVTKGAGVFFKASVVDLAGDGNQEVVVESNSIGTCKTCLSEVRVYQVKNRTITKVLEEEYDDINFAKGRGLWLHSFKMAHDGQMVPMEKALFGAEKWQ